MYLPTVAELEFDINGLELFRNRRAFTLKGPIRRVFARLGVALAKSGFEFRAEQAHGVIDKSRLRWGRILVGSMGDE